HCQKCVEFKTQRRAPYGSLRLILPPPAPFHTIALDFVTRLSLSEDGFDTCLTITCKSSKKVTLILGRADWSAAQ
ncbi:hypothetical protein BJ875DRAFT_374002, partial [Amylocarpus encephaloides]